MYWIFAFMLPISITFMILAIYRGESWESYFFLGMFVLSGIGSIFRLVNIHKEKKQKKQDWDEIQQIIPFYNGRQK